MHRKSLDPPPDPTRFARRNGLLEGLAGRCYIDQQGVFITNHLSTELICFPDDVREENKDRLDSKIRNAIGYATAFRDVEALQALFDIPQSPEGTRIPDTSPNVTLGLYLYLADECSRLGRRTTFLTAMRNARAEQDSEHTLSPRQLYEAARQALTELDMEPKHFAALEQWHQSGRFTVQGVLHQRKAGKLFGAYALLSEQIQHRQSFMGMNLPISFALGNRQTIEGLKPEEVYARVEALVKPENSQGITQCIAWGDNKREERVREVVRDKVKPVSRKAGSGIVIRQILAALPDEVLEILYRKNYSIAYADAETLQNVYPKENIIGVSRNINEGSRSNSYGTVQPHHRTIFICNGRDGQKQDAETRHMGVSQTVLHETLHMAITYLKPDEKGALKQSIERLGEALESGCPVPPYLRAPLRTLPNESLAEVANYQDKRYRKSGYFDLDEAGKTLHDSRWEEAACNLFARMHTEFSATSATPAFEDAAGFAPLQAAGRQIKQTLATALARCREEFPEAGIICRPERRL